MLDIQTHKYYNDCFRMLFNMLEKHIIFAKVKLKIVIVFILKGITKQIFLIHLNILSILYTK